MNNKKYFGNVSKKMENLKNNSTLLQRMSPKAILTVVKEIIPQLKDKINGLMLKLSNINKKKLISSLPALLLAGAMTVSFAGCSPEISDQSLKKYDYTTLHELEIDIIESLGYDPQKVAIVFGRDGFYLADKDKMEEHVYISSNGTVSNRVKVRDEEGKVVSIPFEAKNELYKAMMKANIPTKSSNSTSSKEPERE